MGYKFLASAFFFAMTLFSTAHADEAQSVITSVPDNGYIVLTGAEIGEGSESYSYSYEILDTDGSTVLYQYSGKDFNLPKEELVRITSSPSFSNEDIYGLRIVAQSEEKIVFSTMKRFSLHVDLGNDVGLRDISAGVDHTCAVTTDRTIKCWGQGGNGQLGDGQDANSSTPVDVIGINNADKVYASNDYSCALLTSGQAKCWGKNSNAQLGDGSTTERIEPVLVDAPGVSFIQLSLGNNHTCATSSDNDAYCWGRNNKGKLGDGTQTTRSVPTKVSGLDGLVLKVMAGQQHSCALVFGGAVKCWGNNSNGQLGDGTNAQSNTAVDTINLGDDPVKDLAVGMHHSCAILADNSARCWGKNADGQLGDDTKTKRNTPVDVVSLSSVASIELGYNSSCATLSSGTVKCWGKGGSGELGNGATTLSKVPVTNLSPPSVSVSTGSNHGCSLTSRGEASCWGNNGNGKLGDGTTTASSTPVRVVFN